MGPGRQRELSFRLAAAEVQMVLVIRDRLVERRQIRVDQEVVVAELGLLVPAGATPIPCSPKWIVVFGPMTAPSLMSMNSTLAPGGRRGSPLRSCLWKGGDREKKARYDRDRRPSHSLHRRSPMILAFAL